MGSIGRLLNAIVALALLFLAFAPVSIAETGAEVQARLDGDLAEERPIVIHAIVALCDNANQGIVPVPEQLGNGQDPRSNLYWGALYGVRTHLPRKGGWELIDAPKPADERILKRVVFFQEMKRDGKDVPVFIVADAWDGAKIKQAIRSFLDMAAGQAAETVSVKRESDSYELQAGGSAHLVAYVGHDGLMEFSLSAPEPAAGRSASSSIVLACASKQYFLDHLTSAQSQPLLLTTGLMAPEAYTLDAAIKAWIGGGTSDAVREAAASAYHQYQKCGMGAARRLFWSAP